MTDLQQDLAACIPSNWLDPLLTGPDAALRGNGRWGCEDIERLLNGIRERMQRHAAIAEAVRDAERYRWLRSLDGSCDAAACVNFNIGFDWIEQHGDELDAAIDRAREGDHAS